MRFSPDIAKAAPIHRSSANAWSTARTWIAVREGIHEQMCSGRKRFPSDCVSILIRWVERYLRDARPHLASEPDTGALFLTRWGRAFSPNGLTAWPAPTCRRPSTRRAQHLNGVPVGRGVRPR